MADSYIQGSIAFTCTHAEMALIEEAFQASFDLQDERTPNDLTPEFLAAFPPTTPDDPCSGFLSIFPDCDFPNFGVEFEGSNRLDQPDVNIVSFWGMTDFQAAALGGLIRHCCQDTLRQAPIGFEFAFSCSRARRDEFGGGWCAVFADRIEIETSRQALSRCIEAKHPMGTDRLADHHWVENPDYPLADWQAEIANADTRLGYWDWVAARCA